MVCGFPVILASPGIFPGIMKELIAATRLIASALKMDSGNALLAQKAPEDAEGYQRWVYGTAQASAAAAREGG